MSLDLAALLDHLRASAGRSRNGRLAAAPIPEFVHHRIALTADGRPAVLLACRDRDYRNYSAPVQLENLSVQYAVPCRIIHGNENTEDGNFTVVTCFTADAGLERQFLNVAGLLVEAVGQDPSRLEVTRNVEALVELFRALNEPPRKTVQGLVAEVFVIARSSRPDQLAAAWHVRPEDHFDFSCGDQRIEVKAASGRERRHHFSLEQLQSLPNVEVMIASIFIERSGAGLSLRQLIDMVRFRLVDHPSLAFRVETTIAATLGHALTQCLEDAFDLRLAEQSLRFYRQQDVPIVGAIPTGVSNVHFRADLSVVKAIDLSAAALGLFGAVRPPM